MPDTVLLDGLVIPHPMDYATGQFYSSGAFDLFFFSFFPMVCCIIIIRIFSDLTNRSCNKSLTSRAFYSKNFPTQLTIKYLGTVVSRARTSPVSSIFPHVPSFLGARSLGHTAILISYARASSYWPSLHSNVAICPICQLCRRRRCLTAEVLKRFLVHMQLFYALLIRVSIPSPYIARPAKQNVHWIDTNQPRESLNATR